ncbi:MAG: T9SS type A sorting domain-containing protein [Bacteroidales bacterium]|nr:T9SS type A sorting domain-containing protein [Bacteroidales bacterium]
MKIRNLLVYLVALTGGVGLIVLTASWMVGYHNRGEADLKGGNGVDRAAAYLLSIRSNQVTGTVDMNDVLQARNQAARLAGNSTRGLNITWTEMGPDNYGGRTRSIIVDNRDLSGQTLYAASVSGGIWKSTNSGQTWARINGFEENPNIVCMVQASNGDIYAGTGEYFIAPDDRISRYSGFIGRGIFLCTDGNSFQVIPSTVPDLSEGTSSLWAYVNKMAIEPGSGRIYAATNGGLIYTDNGFDTYSFTQASTGDVLDTIATDVEIASNGLVAAVVAMHCYISPSGSPSGFVDQSTRYYSSPDTIVNETKLPMENIARLELAVAPSNNDVIYAMTASSQDAVHQLEFGELEGIYLSEDKGESWMIIGPGGSNQFNVMGDGTDYYGFYNNTLAVHPTDPYVILAGGVDMWEGEKVNGTGFYNWIKKSSSMEGVYTYVHSSHHVYAYNPANPSICYLGTDGGMFITSDNFLSFRSINKQYNTSQFYSVGFDRRGYPIGGTQGNGIVYLDHQGNTPEAGSQLGWSATAMNGGYQEISMIMPNCFILSGEALNLFRSDDYGRNFSPVFLPTTITNPNSFLTPFALWESFNNENSRDSVTFIAEKDYGAGDTVMVASNNNSVLFPYVTPLWISEGDSVTVKDVVSTRFFLAVNNAVYMTSQVLDFTIEPTYFKIATIQGNPLCIAYSGDGNYVYVGTDGGNVYRIANLALAHDTATADISSNACIVATSLVASYAERAVTSIAVDPSDPDHVVFTLGNYGNTDYVFRTTNAIDSLPTFTSIQGNLPKMPVYSSLIELNNSNRIILGTELGIWSTDNAGTNTVWINENEGMGNVPVFMIKQQRLAQYPISNYAVIYAATHGRGIFQSVDFVGLDDPDDPVTADLESLHLYPNPATDQIRITMNMHGKADVSMVIYDLSGQKVKDVMHSSQVAEGKQEIQCALDNLKSGTYILVVTSGGLTKSSKFILMR